MKLHISLGLITDENVWGNVSQQQQQQKRRAEAVKLEINE